MKLTKRAYEAAKAEINARIDMIQAEIEAISVRYECSKAPDAIEDLWNNLVDLRYDLNKEIDWLNYSFRIRNWKSQDYGTRALVDMNVD